MSFEDEVRARAKTAFGEFKTSRNVPALSYGVTYRDRLIAAEHLGLIDTSNGTPADNHSIFPIASMTKSFAGAAILVLRDRGLLSLSDRIVDYIPQLKIDPHWKDITINDLTTMNALLPEDNEWADRQLGLSDEEFTKIYERGASGEFVYNESVGSSTAYSNISYMMLGRVISLAAKEHALSFISKNLIKPLGLDSTCWNTNHFSSSRYARGYTYGDIDVPSVSSIGDGAVFAGLFSNVRDVLLWVNFLIDTENPNYEKILSCKSRLELRSRGKILEDEGAGGKVGYAFGMVTTFLQKSRTISFGHSGGLPGFGSRMTFVPEHQLAIVSLANFTYATGRDVCDQLADELMDVLPRPTYKAQPIVKKRYQELLTLIRDWSDNAAEETFATNFFLDNDINLIESKFLELKALIGKNDCTLVAEKYLAAKIKLEGKLILCFTLAPLEFGKIQFIEFLNGPLAFRA